MTKGYRIPKIEEFVEGFVYEHQEFDTKKWVAHTVSYSDINNMNGFFMRNINSKSIRVKTNATMSNK